MCCYHKLNRAVVRVYHTVTVLPNHLLSEHTSAAEDGFKEIDIQHEGRNHNRYSCFPVNNFVS